MVPKANISLLYQGLRDSKSRICSFDHYSRRFPVLGDFSSGFLVLVKILAGFLVSDRPQCPPSLIGDLHVHSQCYRVLHSVTQCHVVLQDVTQCHRVLHSATQCFRVLYSVTHCFTMLYSVLWYNRVLTLH